MITPPLTKAERDDLMARYAKATAAYRAAVMGDDRNAAARATRDSKAALNEYFERLPVVAMSACPFTGKPLLRSFDPFGVDGPLKGARQDAILTAQTRVEVGQGPDEESA